MINIQFGNFTLWNRPSGLKQSECDIFSDYIAATRGNIPDWRKLSPADKLFPYYVSKATLCCFAFQVRLLGGNPLVGNYSDFDRNQWEILSSLKADVIEKQGNNYTIYELKQRLDVSVLGQLLTYKWLFEEVFGYPKNTTLVAVGDTIIPGLVQPLLSNGIRVCARDMNWGIPPNFDATSIRSQTLSISRVFNTGR